jgi:DTW domain-containing protein
MHLHVCICSRLPRLQTRTRVILLLHQLEARKTTNTGRLALHCLPNSVLAYRGRLTTEEPPNTVALDPRLEPPWIREAARPVLLFPDEAAEPLERWRGAEPPVTLVVPDGTWSQTARARRRIAGLDRLPCAALSAVDVSPHRLRRDPRPGRISTLEALARALGILEGPECEQALLDVHRLVPERTLWSKGRLAPHLVTGGLPAGAKPHDPRSGLPTL